MLDKLFNKKDPKSKVTKAEDTKKGVSSMRIIAKETLMFPSMAKQLRSLSNVFARYVKLHNIRPATPGSISDVKKSLSESKEIKVASIKVKKYGTEKKKTFLAGILDSIITIIKGLIIGTLLAGGYIVYKLIEIITPYVESLMAKAEEGITFISDGIKNFYENVNWLDLFVSSFKKYLSFISFGLISEEQVGNYISQAGSFYKETIGRIGSFLQMAVEWLSPRLQKVGRLFATNILGVDVDALAEKRETKQILAENAIRLQKQYGELVAEEKTLVLKKRKLSHEKEILEIKKETEEKKKQIEEIENAPKKAVPFLQRLFKKEKKEPLPPIEDRSIPLAPYAPAPSAPTPKAEPAPTPLPSVTASKVTPSEPIILKEKEKPVQIQTPSVSPQPQKQEKEKINLNDYVKVMPGVDIIGLAPDFSNRIALMAKDFFDKTKIKLQINSGYRSSEKQQQLYAEYLAKGGKSNPKLAPVAKPGTSFHEKKLAVDIQATSGPKGTGSTKGFLNELAGYVDNPSGWLESFGIIRPVTSAKVGADRKEDWHIQIAGSVPTPDAPDGSTTSVDSQGKPIDVSTGKTEVGTELSKASNQLSIEQREQSKPQNPTIILAGTKNNIVAETKRTNVPVPA